MRNLSLPKKAIFDNVLPGLPNWVGKEYGMLYYWRDMKLYFLSPLILQKIIWIPTRLILRGFGHLTIRGSDHLKGVKSPVIFAVNHSSEMDPILIPASLPFWSRFSPIFYASRSKSFYQNSGWRQHIYGGWFFKMWGSYPIFPGLKDYERSLRNHIEIINDGGSLCVFPEGKITPDGNIQQAHGGIAYLAMRTNCTVIPVGISGSYRTPAKEFFSGKRRITVSFGEPIIPSIDPGSTSGASELLAQQCKDEANAIMSKIAALKV